MTERPVMALIVDPVQGTGTRHVPRRGPTSFADAGYCGRSFNEGVLRFHDATTAPNFRDLCHEAFPELRRLDRKADVLAFDWSGKQYLTAKIAGSKDLTILVADIGTGTLETLATVAEFAVVLKMDNMRDFFNAEAYDQWRTHVGHPDDGLAFTDCVEYTTPLWLGGEDDPTNMQLIDMDVSWTIGTQLLTQTRAAQL
ncbi:MAG: hypothetical protein LBI33_03245 [Propionibacteriaceae bacterium]|jgi:hypothetical protein|nr:hypothetical protein [Propionibacteriaceae bacterium]